MILLCQLLHIFYLHLYIHRPQLRNQVSILTVMFLSYNIDLPYLNKRINKNEIIFTL